MLMPNEILLAFDPGHGTREYMSPAQGKHSPDYSIYEGEYVREIVARLMPACEELGFRVTNIVPEKLDISRPERCYRANSLYAKNPNMYYISVHLNASPPNDNKWHKPTGFAVYVCDRASEKSRILAKNICDAAMELGLSGDRDIPPCHYWTANYDVITRTRMPAVLTENLFQDNKQDVAYLLSEAGKEAIVNLHIAGICKTFGIPYTIKRV